MSGAARQAAIRAFAALPSGIHAIPREQASELLKGGLEGERTLLWIDISNPADAEAEYLRSELGFHPLAVEDCIRGRQRPKLDRYPDYFFLVLYAASVNPARQRMALNEVHVFLGEDFLVTVHDHKVDAVGEIVARWRTAPGQILDPGALAHLLLDVVVDDYFLVVEHFAERTEAIEAAVFSEEEIDSAAVHQLRHELVLFRRVVTPLRDVLGKLLRRDLPFLRPELLPYFQDVHDHTIRVTEEIDSQRELLSALLDAQVSASTRQLNQTMRTLTVWSIILMSMALVAGIYGMNFALMPELTWRWGYYASLALMAAIGLTLLVVFKRRGWM